MSDLEPTPIQEDASQRQPIPLPPASFSFLVLSLRAQAEMQLGLMHFGPRKRSPSPILRWRGTPSI